MLFKHALSVDPFISIKYKSLVNSLNSTIHMYTLYLLSADVPLELRKSTLCSSSWSLMSHWSYHLLLDSS